jgi:hypothetical protein
MLIDIKATLLRWTDDSKKVELTLLKELLDSKDFKVHCCCPIVWWHNVISRIPDLSYSWIYGLILRLES